MRISRRDFIKWSIAASVALKVKLDFDKINTVLAAETDPPVIWLQGSGCTGCTVSTLNVTVPTTIDDVLLNKISMKYNSTIMASSGELAHTALEQAATQYNGQFILVVEGAIPTGINGNYCVIGEENGVNVTIKDAVLKYGPMAKYVVAAGTCAYAGGVAGAYPNNTSCTSVGALLNGLTVNPVINLSGCPVHPTILVQTLIDLILTGVPSLDSENRPSAYYRDGIHSACPRRGAKQSLPGTWGCFKSVGCQGPNTKATCPTMLWNNGRSWCHQVNYPCMGCVNNTFPTNPLTI